MLNSRLSLGIYFIHSSVYMGFPGGSVARNLPAIQEPHETRVRSCVSKIPWRRTWQPTPVLLPGECHGQKILAGYRPWGGKEWDTTERLSMHKCSIYIYIYIYNIYIDIYTLYTIYTVYIYIYYIYIFIHLFSTFRKQRSWHLIPSLHGK